MKKQKVIFSAEAQMFRNKALARLKAEWSKQVKQYVDGGMQDESIIEYASGIANAMAILRETDVTLYIDEE